MTTALVVDDAKVDQLLAGTLLENQAGLTVVYANDGRQALAAIERATPDIVVTDLRMPDMDGLELVESIRERTSIPVILMTAHGSEEIAAEALRRGAASYVPKAYLSTDLARTVAKVLRVAGALVGEAAFTGLTETEVRFVLENDISQIQPVIGHLKQEFSRMEICDAVGLLQLGMAFDEALSNAIHHGNLEVSSELREGGMEAYLREIERRRVTPPYAGRRVHVTARVSRTEGICVIRDEGKGFDPSKLPDPTDPSNLGKASGRGMLLIRTFMDEVRYNDTGNELTLVKRRFA
ncbi:MAG: response regulator [Planctomycetota bacterium]|nr:response regulator [Planctomycetota bacterium]